MCYLLASAAMKPRNRSGDTEDENMEEKHDYKENKNSQEKSRRNTAEGADERDLGPIDSRHDMMDYCPRLLSACLANAALCRSHRVIDNYNKKTIIENDGENDGEDAGKFTTDEGKKQGDNKEIRFNYLSCKVLSNMSTLDLLNSSFCVPDNALLLARMVSILEKLRK